jgi:Uncharacterised nucleotidyltransferase
MLLRSARSSPGASHSVHPPALTGAVRRSAGLFPTADQEALLRAALCSPPELEPSLRRRLDRERLDLDYPSLTLIPLLHRNLARHDADPGLSERLSGIHRWSWHRNQLLFAALSSALSALRAAGVEALLIKGVPLALGAYDDAGARVMGDADVIVRRGDLGGALEALGGAGWNPERSVTGDVVSSLTGVDLRDARGQVLDLHWHVLLDSYDPDLDEVLWEGAGLIEVRGERARCLNPADHLLEIVSHGLSWAANPPLHWVADAVVLLRAHGAAVDWDRLREQAWASHRVQVMLAGLRYLARTFEVPIPPGALARLERLPSRLGERTALWFGQRAGPRWPWGRAPLVAASYARSARARGRFPGPIGFLRFLSTRAGCSPGRWLALAIATGFRQALVALRSGGERLIGRGEGASA